MENEKTPVRQYSFRGLLEPNMNVWGPLRWPPSWIIRMQLQSVTVTWVKTLIENDPALYPHILAHHPHPPSDMVRTWPCPAPRDEHPPFERVCWGGVMRLRGRSKTMNDSRREVLPFKVRTMDAVCWVANCSPQWQTRERLKIIMNRKNNWSTYALNWILKKIIKCCPL